MRYRTLISTALLLSAAATFAQKAERIATLMPGDAPPAMTISKWVKGTPVADFEKGKVYVVEFWATWCGPCRVSIPHLTDLSKKFAGKATFVGVSVWETKQSDVEPFVQQMGDKMDYNIAMDDLKGSEGREGVMAKDWMAAAMQRGIPTAFVIDQNRQVAWIGHPMELDGPLTQIVDGKWDLAAFQKEFGDNLAEIKKAMGAQKPIREATLSLNKAMKAKDYPAALKACDDLDALAPQAKFTTDFARYQIFTFTGEKDKATAKGAEIMKMGWDQAALLNNFAWFIVDPAAKLEKRDGFAALKAASRAVELSKGQEAAFLDTLAWAYWFTGDKGKAVETEAKALAAAGEADKADYQKTLTRMMNDKEPPAR
ncbi:MAG: redoxin domain-containing protein [Fimbriimonas ginsengisoli]|uniref:Redoxin domain-containing protein n=1 Tax=Fimbriimonas ginsengisoli TaxID=1005039 RepID=A0A931LZI0_FIMGI|nr:redoxin domain-containing protein [Fimbriimonas ginsengisoli]